MNQEELQEYTKRQPFEPFRLTLSTGATIDIRHPDLIMVGRRAAIVGFVNDPDGTAFDRSMKIDLVHIVSTEELPKASPPSANGSQQSG